MTDARFLYVTCKDVEQARAIARAALEKRLVACANILPTMESLYHWEEKLVQEQKTVLILKTVAAKVPHAIECIKALHSYETPCIVSLAIEAGHASYLDWLRSEVR